MVGVLLIVVLYVLHWQPSIAVRMFWSSPRIAPIYPSTRAIGGRSHETKSRGRLAANQSPISTSFMDEV
jgi:hypothetical protein